MIYAIGVVCLIPVLFCAVCLIIGLVTGIWEAKTETEQDAKTLRRFELSLMARNLQKSNRRTI